MRRNIVISILTVLVIIQWIVIINISTKKTKIVKKPAISKKAVLPKVAIIIDDWGYNLKYVDYLDKIKIPITVSILPTVPYSKEVAQIVHDKGFEVMVHQPLEPLPPENRLEKKTIMTNMSDSQINTFLTIKYAKGINNHQGSKVITDKRIMTVILERLGREGMFFVDSMTNLNTVVPALSKKLRVRFARRDVFIDNEDNEIYIENQINALIEKAKKNGYAIGIGHYRPNTLKAVAEFADKHKESKEVRFVFASDLVK